MVHGGGHGFDDPGAAPTEAQVTRLIVQYFLETLVLGLHGGPGRAPDLGLTAPPDTRTLATGRPLCQIPSPWT